MSQSRPDKCSDCAKPCAIFFTQVMGGEETKVGMCSSCPMAEGVVGSKQFDLLTKLTGQAPAGPLLAKALAGSGARCPECGFTPEQFKERGRLGCPHCYEFYAGKLHPILDRIHSGTEHRGKFPKKYRKQISQKQIQELRNRLQELVQREEYEEAAVVRDRLKEIERS